MYAPLNYNQLNCLESAVSPSTYKVINTAAFTFWERALFQRAVSAIQINGLPEGWKGEVKDFFDYALFKRGFLGVFDTDEYGIAFQYGTLSGFNFYYQPVEFLVSNPALSKSFKIGEDCELIKLTPDYQGIWDIIYYYAEKLANLDNAINISIKNLKVPMIMGAKNKAAAEAIKKVIDQIDAGNTLAVYDTIIKDDSQSKDSPFQVWERGHSIKEMYVTDMQLRDMQTLLNSFDKEVGIPSMSYEKKERMNTGEVDMIVADASCRLSVWLRCLNNSFDKVNKMFGLHLSACAAYDTEGGCEDGKINHNRN